MRNDRKSNNNHVKLLISKRKVMKKLLILGSAALMMVACNNQNKTNDTGVATGTDAPPPSTENSTIAPNNPADVLPHAAKEFISTHFPNTTILHVENKQNPTTDGTVFEVELSDKTDIDFDKDGEWREISAEDGVNIPMAVLADNVQSHLKSKYPNLTVRSIDKDIDVMAVEMSNEVDVIFDLAGKFLREER